MLQITGLSINTRVELQIAEQSTLIPHFKHKQAVGATIVRTSFWGSLCRSQICLSDFTSILSPNGEKQDKSHVLDIINPHHQLSTAEPDSERDLVLWQIHDLSNILRHAICAARPRQPLKDVGFQRKRPAVWSRRQCHLIHLVHGMLAFLDSELVRKDPVWWQRSKQPQTITTTSSMYPTSPSISPQNRPTLTLMLSHHTHVQNGVFSAFEVGQTSVNLLNLDAGTTGDSCRCSFAAAEYSLS